MLWAISNLSIKARSICTFPIFDPTHNLLSKSFPGYLILVGCSTPAHYYHTKFISPEHALQFVLIFFSLLVITQILH